MVRRSSQRLAQSVRQSVALEQLSRLFVKSVADARRDIVTAAGAVGYIIQCAVRRSIENHLVVSAAASIMVRTPFGTQNSRDVPPQVSDPALEICACCVV